MYTVIYKTQDEYRVMVLHREETKWVICFYPSPFLILFIASLPKTDPIGEMEAIWYRSPPSP